MKISIISPVYNAEKYIDRCIRSVLSQQYKDYELILIDDHSTDSSLAKCQKWKNIDNRIIVMENPSKGVSSARNVGIKRASGEYIMFIDSDDSLSENALPEFLNKIVDLGKSDIVISTYVTIYPGGKTESHIIPDFHGDISLFCQHIEEYLNAAVLQGPCWKLFKRKLLIDNNIIFPENMDYGEDAYFVYEYLKHINNVIAFNNATYHYHLQDVSLSQGFRRQKYQTNLMLNERLDFLLKFHLGSTDNKLLLNRNRLAFLMYLDECALVKNKKTALTEINCAINCPQTLTAFNDEHLSVKHCVIKFFIQHRMRLCLLLAGTIHARRMIKMHREN